MFVCMHAGLFKPSEALSMHSEATVVAQSREVANMISKTHQHYQRCKTVQRQVSIYE